MASAKSSEDNKPAMATPASVHLDAAVFGASVQLPSFDKIEEETWFAMADANFALRKVKDSTTKYYYVLSKLDASTLRKLSSFIKRPRGDDPYSEIKEELFEAYEPPLEQKLDALLSLAGMGDESPKEYGMEIKRLASDATLDDVLKRILGTAIDSISRRKCLLDTGSQVSLWPPSPTTSTIHSSRVRLGAANGTPIKAFGSQKKKIKIGDKSNSFIFIIAQVARPILGLDFLPHFGMSINLLRGRLIHSGVSTHFSATTSAISGVNVVLSESPFVQILREFPEISNVELASSTTKHGVECYIHTSGPPIRTPLRRLSPEKLRVAKQYFDGMCAAGICRRSDSPWSSGLHLVLKKDGTRRISQVEQEDKEQRVPDSTRP